jgi:predicted DNA-binding transcriptional regulator AlpA
MRSDKAAGVEAHALVTVAEIAHRTGLSQSTLYNKINNGSVPVAEVTRPLRISAADIATPLQLLRTSCSYRQAARALRIAEGTVNSWIAKGWLQRVNVWGIKLISSASLASAKQIPRFAPDGPNPPMVRYPGGIAKGSRQVRSALGERGGTSSCQRGRLQLWDSRTAQWAALKKGQAFAQLTKDLKRSTRDLLSAADVAKFLGVSRRTVRRLGQRNQLQVAGKKIVAASVWNLRLAWRRQFSHAVRVRSQRLIERSA